MYFYRIDYSILGLQMSLAQWILTAALAVAATHASTLTLVAPVPSSVTVQAGGKVADLDAVNSALLGLSANPSSSAVQKALFGQPRALVIVEVTDATTPLSLSGSQATLTGTYEAGEAQRLRVAILDQFEASEFTAAWVDGAAAGGSQDVVDALNAAKVDTSKLKTKGSAQLTQALKLAKAIEQDKATLSAIAGPAFFHVTLSGAEATASDIAYVVKKLAKAAQSVYGKDSVVVEVDEWDTVNNRKKRDTTSTVPVMTKRQTLNVAVFSGTDYPAIFAIFAGLTIILALALLYIAVGLWNMDPGKDSIIYRMTTTRMKKD